MMLLSNIPSGGLHYILYVNGEQAKRIGSKTCITHNGIQYNMYDKFKVVFASVKQARYPNMVNLSWKQNA